MAVSSLSLDPRYAALMTTARAMLQQRPDVAPQPLDQHTARRLVPVLRSARIVLAGAADPAAGRTVATPPEVQV